MAWEVARWDGASSFIGLGMVPVGLVPELASASPQAATPKILQGYKV